jgi:hypothetical protein
MCSLGFLCVLLLLFLAASLRYAASDHMMRHVDEPLMMSGMMSGISTWRIMLICHS